jgi:6-phosphogluconate dehydrogenase
MSTLYDIGLIGIAVMGENLALNLERNGHSVFVSSRNQSTIDSFLNGRAKHKNISGSTQIETLVKSLKPPRKILLMIKAGKPVDDVIEQLIPLLSKGDVILDGGNSYYHDTTRRTAYLKEKELLFVGTGVSGGEEGALLGPSIMPGGHPEAWPLVKPILQSIAAKVDDGGICCDWVGQDGAGHFVKMVHNGIEYGDIQLINEVYHFMRDVLKLSNHDMSNTFSNWNKKELNSYLVEITAHILNYQDEHGHYVVDQILDTAGQKGTGKWTVEASLDQGTSTSLIAESVYARILSSLKEERVLAEKAFPKQLIAKVINKDTIIDTLKEALYAAKILSYAQGFQLMNAASKSYDWALNFGQIALMWREGCIIRSVFLNDIKKAFETNASLPNLILDPFFKEVLKQTIPSLREVVSASVSLGIPVPALSAALSYFDQYTTGRLPSNLLQAQRDFFGAHTYERIDQARGEFFHTNWTGRGGNTSSTTYNV